MEQLSFVQQLVVFLPPLVLAITLHEVAHGFCALLFGDDTAKRAGRLSLNPLVHVDWVGTVLLPALLLFLSGFVFGWAKPVPVDVRRLHPRRLGLTLVSLAGPLANLAMALLWVVVARAALWLDWPFASVPLLYMSYAGIFLNLVLMAINLLPIPPLDGGHALMGILPPRLAMRLALLEPYGTLILLLLLVTGMLGKLLLPVIVPLFQLLASLAGFSASGGV